MTRTYDRYESNVRGVNAMRGISPELEAAILAMPGVTVKHGRPLDTKPDPMPAELSEKEFQAKVIEHAISRSWLVYHTYNSVRSRAGFPDLVCVRDRVVFAELKTESGTLAKDQREWRDALKEAGAEWHLWRPSDWSAIQAVLS